MNLIIWQHYDVVKGWVGNGADVKVTGLGSKISATGTRWDECLQKWSTYVKVHIPTSAALLPWRANWQMRNPTSYRPFTTVNYLIETVWQCPPNWQIPLAIILQHVNYFIGLRPPNTDTSSCLIYNRQLLHRTASSKHRYFWVVTTVNYFIGTEVLLNTDTSSHVYNRQLLHRTASSFKPLM